MNYSYSSQEVIEGYRETIGGFLRHVSRKYNPTEFLPEERTWRLQAQHVLNIVWAASNLHLNALYLSR